MLSSRRSQSCWFVSVRALKLYHEVCPVVTHNFRNVKIMGVGLDLIELLINQEANLWLARGATYSFTVTWIIVQQ